jgi:hypothetical protein
MKRIFLLTILFFTAIAQAATTPEVETEPIPKQEKTRPAPQNEHETIKQPRKDHQWPRQFVPSEQIGADSVVSFPADI